MSPKCSWLQQVHTPLAERDFDFRQVQRSVPRVRSGHFRDADLALKEKRFFAAQWEHPELLRAQIEDRRLAFDVTDFVARDVPAQRAVMRKSQRLEYWAYAVVARMPTAGRADGH